MAGCCLVGECSVMVLLGLGLGLSDCEISTAITCVGSFVHTVHALFGFWGGGSGHAVPGSNLQQRISAGLPVAAKTRCLYTSCKGHFTLAWGGLCIVVLALIGSDN